MLVPVITYRADLVLAALLWHAFPSADSTDLNGEALQVGGVNWIVIAGGWDTQGNAARCWDLTGTYGPNIVVADAGVSDVIYTVDLFYNSSNGGSPWGNAGVYLRCDPVTGSGIEVYLDAVGQVVNILTNDGAGTRTLVDFTAFTVNFNTTYQIRVVCAGTSITVFIDDVEILAVSTSFNQSETAFGLWTWSDISGGGINGDDYHRWDNYLVEA